MLTASAYPSVVDGGAIRSDAEWLPALGLGFTLRLDGFAWMFSVLVTGIGFLVVLYARYYMSPSDPVPRFFSLLLAFMGSMLGIVVAGNLIVLVFFWELTSIFSFLLIGYWHGNAGARDGARMALVVTGLGGLALLAGVILIGEIVGSYDLDRVLAAGDTIARRRNEETAATAWPIASVPWRCPPSCYPPSTARYWLPLAISGYSSTVNGSRQRSTLEGCSCSLQRARGRPDGDGRWSGCWY